MSAQRSLPRLIDIGANLTCKVFAGIYDGRQLHENDFDSVLERAYNTGLEKIIVTGTSLTDSEEAIALCKNDRRLVCTVGCHPTRAQEYYNEPDIYLSRLEKLVQVHRTNVVAVGECGLDYYREEFCPRDHQIPCFEAQLSLAAKVGLPLFLHCRAAHDDLIKCVKRVSANLDSPLRGVVHSFDGSLSDATHLIDMGFFIGLNGCSLKKEENLEVVRSLPVDRILLETDAPWCEIRSTHAGHQYVETHRKYVKSNRWHPGCFVKGRNEPCNIVQVLEAVAGVKAMATGELAYRVYKNTLKLFSLS